MLMFRAAARLRRISPSICLTWNRPVAVVTSSPCCAPVTDTRPTESVSRAIHILRIVRPKVRAVVPCAAHEASSWAPANGKRVREGGVQTVRTRAW